MHETEKRNHLGLARPLAALASLGAGVIHLAVTPDHWQAWPLYGVFFLGIALFQLIWAGAVLLVPHQIVLVLGLVANLAAMALWGASRAWGPPIGPGSGTPEPVGVSGVLTVSLEAIAALTILMFLAPRRQPAAALGRGGYRLALGGAALAITALTTPGVIAAFGHDHGSHGEHGVHHETGPQEPGHHAPAVPPQTSGTLPAPPPPVRTEVESGHGHHDH